MRPKILLLVLFLSPFAAFAGGGEFLSKGKAFLAEGDFIRAEENFDEAVKAEPRLNEDVGGLWFEKASEKAKTGELETAAAMFSKAVFYNSDLAPGAGEALLSAGENAAGEDAWMRLAHRAIPFAGAKKVLSASLGWYEKRFGPARAVVVENPGWLSVGEARQGFTLRYLSEFPFLERDGEIMRIMPEAVERATELSFDSGDSGPSEIMFSRQKEPATVYLWIIPAEKPAAEGDTGK